MAAGVWGLKLDQVKRLKEPELESVRRRKAISDLTLDKLILRAVSLALHLRNRMNVSMSVSGYAYDTAIYLASGDAVLDLDGIYGGNCYLSSGHAIIDGTDSSDIYSDNVPSYYFSTGKAVISDANAQFNNYYLSSGAATINAGGSNCKKNHRATRANSFSIRHGP